MKCEYKDFLTANGFTEADLPEPLREMTKIFERVTVQLKDVTGEDRKELLRLLKKLDLEILYWIMEAWKDRLENYALSDAQVDESILEDLVNMLVHRSDLRNAGFRGDLSGRIIRVGDYLLERTSPFVYKFRVRKSPQRNCDFIYGWSELECL